MIIPKGELVELGKRCSFKELFGDLSESGFSGYVEVSYKLDELSRGKVLFSKGEIVAAEIRRIISKKEISGQEALKELMELENCVADVYSLTPEAIVKAIEWNKGALVGLPEETGITAETVEEVTAEEVTAPEDREAIIRKYGIKVPSEEEIDQLIMNVLEDRTAISPSDFQSVQNSLIEVANRYLGKLSRKVVEIIKSCSSMEELVERFPEIQRTAKSLVVFIPRKKIDEMLSEMEEVIGKEI